MTWLVFCGRCNRAICPGCCYECWEAGKILPGHSQCVWPHRFEDQVRRGWRTMDEYDAVLDPPYSAAYDCDCRQSELAPWLGE
jgi:hypothetical protein